ncbi:hypothetical protein [Mycobacterium tuberculosis]|nr:hypothetical protein [Mycobacterium tuberculosis]
MARDVKLTVTGVSAPASVATLVSDTPAELAASLQQAGDDYANAMVAISR